MTGAVCGVEFGCTAEVAAVAVGNKDGLVTPVAVG